MSDDSLEVATLLGHRETPTALRCLASFVRYSVEPVRFRIHDDGTLSESDVAELRAQLPVEDVVTRATADIRISDWLGGFGNCLRLRTTTPLALKLFDIVGFEPTETVRYLDSDVLFVRPFRNPFLDRAPDEELFFPDRQSAYSIGHRDLSRLGRRRPPERLNTGLIRFPKRRFDPAPTEHFLRTWKGYAAPWIEQTCWALLAGEACTLSRNQAEIFDPHRTLRSTIVALHFVSSVRSALESFPSLDRSAEPPIAIGLEKRRRLGHVSLLYDRIRRWATHRLVSASGAPSR